MRMSQAGVAASAARIVTLLACALFGLVGQVHAQTAEIVSSYTSTTEKACKAVDSKGDPDDDGFVHVCPGIGSLIVLNSEGDLRETVSVGRTRDAAAKEPAAQHWFSPFSSTTNTIEWRHHRGGPPFAIIQRWHLADSNDPDKDGRPRTKQLLVITRLPPGAVCHVAYVDVKANTDANEIARRAANNARAFDCAKDKVRIEGISGRAVELAQSR